jgi:hypothetical protein
MRDTGQMTTRLHVSAREGDWRRAAEYRRQRGPDTMPTKTPVPEARTRLHIATLVRLIPGHA